jgi:hypothetical protein
MASRWVDRRGPSGGELVGHLMVMVQEPVAWTSKI